jgi:hypothetical protein
MTEAAAAAPAATPAAAPAAAPAAPAIAWLPGADEATIGYVQNKGWQGPADALTGYRNLETMLGADRAGRTVVLPADENDQPAWQKVYERLGRPANAADYKLPVPEGADASFATEAAAKFHELGVPLKAAKALTEWWNGKAAGFAQNEQAQLETQAAAEQALLDKDWGTEKAGRMELARRAAVSLGLDAASIDAMQRGGGYAKALKALAKVGDMMRESGAEGLSDIGSFSMTPESARSKRAQLMADADWRKRAMNANSAEWSELRKLDGIITSVQQ